MASGRGKKNGRGKDKAKSSKKTRAKTAAAKASTALMPDDRNAEKRVALLREKLKKSLQDPEMRAQMVRAIRVMMDEGRS